MKLVIIRHGDPDYEKDWLTPKGLKEAEYLSERVAKMDVRDFYVSPLGRAKATASFSLEKMGRTATQLEWLKEFPVKIDRPDYEGKCPIAWDWMPKDWLADESFFSKDHWFENPVMRDADIKAEYKRVIGKFDELLETYGYRRDGNWYRVEKANNETIVFFCHFGSECVLLSHLLNVSPMVLWHGFCAAPTSVTTVVTEERQKGIAGFRISSFGDVSHLYAHDEDPAFAGRFCECFDNTNERH